MRMQRQYIDNQISDCVENTWLTSKIRQTASSARKSYKYLPQAGHTATKIVAEFLQLAK